KGQAQREATQARVEAKGPRGQGQGQRGPAGGRRARQVARRQPLQQFDPWEPRLWAGALSRVCAARPLGSVTACLGSDVLRAPIPATSAGGPGAASPTSTLMAPASPTP